MSKICQIITFPENINFTTSLIFNLGLSNKDHNNPRQNSRNFSFREFSLNSKCSKLTQNSRLVSFFYDTMYMNMSTIMGNISVLKSMFVAYFAQAVKYFGNIRHYVTSGNFWNIEKCLASVVPHSGILIVETIYDGIDQTGQVHLNFFVAKGNSCGSQSN